MAFADLARRTGHLLVKNSPNIMTTIGVVGTVTTAYLVGKASFQAADIIRLKENSDEQRGIPVPAPKELLLNRVKLVYPLYIPSLIMGATTIGAIVGSNRVSAGRLAGVATAYGLLEKNFTDQKQVVLDKLGARKAQEIDDEVAARQVAELDQSFVDGVDIHGLKQGQLIYDTFGAQTFRHTVEGIMSAKNDLNHKLINYGTMSLADFYQFLGFEERPAFSETLGWNSDTLVEIRIGATEMNGIPVLTMSYATGTEPAPDYGRNRRFH